MKWTNLSRFVWPAGVAVCCILFIFICVRLVHDARPKSVKHPSTNTKPHIRTPQKQTPVTEQPTWTFPGGGTHLLPEHRIVALYGTPNAPSMGGLGEQPIDATITRVKDMAAQYQPLSKQPILPAFEIIATIASNTPTGDGDYSNELDPGKLQPWIDAARTAGVYVVLDLQPGRDDFLSQAKQYESLLKQPNVGLALDPEWRLGSDQKPLVQIGSVSVDEVNQTAGWLADMTAKDKLPQKLFLLHQFRTSMIPNRQALIVTHPELAYAIQMDGQGLQPVKRSTWSAITANPPENMHFGWKNFYQKDSPVLTPEQTMQITPIPWYISYQ
jgi:hypothetical protein